MHHIQLYTHKTFIHPVKIDSFFICHNFYDIYITPVNKTTSTEKPPKKLLKIATSR